MLKILFSFIAFIVLLSCIAYGAVWIVDNKVNVGSIGKKGADSFQNLSLSLQGNNTKSTTAASTEVVGGKVKVEPDVPIGTDASPGSVDVVVLNGGGPIGAAGKMANYLVSKGYAKAKASNAKNYSYEGLTVYYDKEGKVDAEAVRTVLVASYPNVRLEEAKSDAERVSRVTVIIGE